MELTSKQIRKLIDDAPDKCIITGLSKCDSYVINNNVVYLTEPAYDAYTLPEYDEEHKSFHWTHYDMDDGFIEEVEGLCDLDDLRKRDDFEEIKRFYNISE